MRAVRIIVYAFAGLGSRQVGWRDDHGWRSTAAARADFSPQGTARFPDDDADRGVTLTYFDPKRSPVWVPESLKCYCLPRG